MPITPEQLEVLRRNSGIALSSAGLWSYDNAEVPHPRVQELFHKGVEVRDSGDVVLNVGKYWCYVSCESVARFVEGIALEVDEGALVVRFKGGFRAASGVPPKLGFDPQSRLFIWIPGHPVATFTQQAHNALAGHMDADDEGGVRLTVGRAVWRVAPLRSTPAASDSFEDLLAG